MSPFSIFLRDLRHSRGLRQKEMAVLLGYEQSYISALELGLKGPPRLEFLNRLAQKLHLNEEEMRCMNSVVVRSKRRIVVPLGAAEAEYELCYRLEQQLSRLEPIQIELISLALRMSSRHVDLAEPSTKRRFGIKKQNHFREEETM